MCGKAGLGLEIVDCDLVEWMNYYFLAGLGAWGGEYSFLDGFKVLFCLCFAEARRDGDDGRTEQR